MSPSHACIHKAKRDTSQRRTRFTRRREIRFRDEERDTRRALFARYKYVSRKKRDIIKRSNKSLPFISGGNINQENKELTRRGSAEKGERRDLQRDRNFLIDAFSTRILQQLRENSVWTSASASASIVAKQSAAQSPNTNFLITVRVGITNSDK